MSKPTFPHNTKRQRDCALSLGKAWLGVLLLFPTLAFGQRDTVSLDFDWRFHRGDAPMEQLSTLTDDAFGETVNLPHDFQIGQPWVPPTKDEHADNSDMAANVKSRLSARGFKEMGIGWYRKVLETPEAWRGHRVELDFGGIMLVGDVYLNGERIGGTDYGYVGFGIDVTDKLHYGGQDVIMVKADTRDANNSRWYTGGGLYRDVRAIVTNKELFFARHPLYITTQGNREVSISAEITRNSRQQRGDVRVRIIDANGQVVAEQTTNVRFSPKRRTREYPLPSITLEHPRLWSPDTPYSYMAVVSLLNNDGTVADEVSERFGVRTIEMGPSFGFKINGEKVILKGIANHHTLGALGAAAYPSAIKKRLQLLKAFGFNHIRCSHNPYSEDLYRLADEMGFLVVDELYDKWLKQYAGGRTEWTNLWQQDIPEWVKRDRNHPSVVLWSLGNELQTYTNLPFNDWGVTAYKLQRQLLQRYDSTRLVTVAMHPRGRNWETDSLPCDLAMVTDIQAYNYRYMYFPGDGRRFPWMTFYQSEASMGAMGPNYYEMNLDKVMGLAYWGMIDYIGESRGWPAKGWTDGVFDISLEPKPKAWFLKSIFSDEPTVHIAVDDGSNQGVEWNGVRMSGDRLSDHWNRVEGKYTVYTYTNADEVELKVNGKSYGSRQNSMDSKTRNKIRWDDIEYEPGYIEAIARTNGREVARHRIETTGQKVARLRLEPDNTSWTADGMDLQHVRVTAVDNKGCRVPMAQGELAFSVEGDAAIIATSNGDMTNHEVDTEPHRQLYNGSALVILRAGQKPSKVTLNVSGEGMKQTLKLVTK